MDFDPFRHPAGGGTRGITLIEMMVVVAVIGLIAGLSFPAATAGIDSVRFASAGRSVAAFLNGAVNRVERLQQPMELVISQKDSTITLYSNQPGFTRELKMPDGVTIQAVLPQVEGDAEEARRLVLMPGASVPGIGIELGNRRGAQQIIRLDPMTGFPHVESVNKE